MSQRDPHDPHEQADLDAALVQLERDYPAPTDVDAELRAMADDPEVQRGIEERRRLEEMPDPAAPQPVEVPSETGVLIVQSEAAATYVPPVEVSLPQAPRMPSAPVRLRTEIDPRRQKTVRVARKPEADVQATTDVGPAQAAPTTERHGKGAAEPASTGEAAEPASTPEAAEPGRHRGAMLGGALLFVAGLITALAVVGRADPTPDTAPSATATPPVGVASTTPVAASTHPAEGPAPSMPATSTAVEMVDPPPRASGVSTAATAPSVNSAPSVSSAASVTLAPKTSGDPYADAAAPSVKSVPSATPVVTAAASAPPASTPAVTSVPPAVSARPAAPKGTGDDEFYIRTNKKQGAKP